MCIGCNERLSIEDIYLLVLIWWKQETAILQLNLYVYYCKKYDFKRFFNFLKEIILLLFSDNNLGYVYFQF